MTTEYITGGIYYVFDKLINRIKEMKNPTVAGLDPNFSYVPEYIREKYASIPIRWKQLLKRCWNTTTG